MGEERKVYKVVVEMSKENKPLKRSRHIWENGIRMDIKEIGWEGVK
jgi:hypothetical protein